MAADFIQPSLSSRCGTLAVQISTDIRIVRDLLVKTKAIMDHNINGADYTALESLFGVSTGSGQPLYNLVAGALAEVQAASNSLQLIDRVG